MMGEELPAADFFDFESLLSVQEQRKLKELRAFLDTQIAPYAGQWWDRAEFPEHILPKLAALRLSAPAQRGYTHLFAGLVIAEMTRVDTSIATFFMVHHDLFVESLYDFGSDAQQDRYLDDASNLRTTGAFALTEPDHGSDVAGGMETTARRVARPESDGGDYWVINGAKRWIGNGTFCDYMLVWAKDEGDGSIRGFIVDASLPGITRTRIENKVALRTVQNADIRFEDVQVLEADRFEGISSFADTNHLLRGSRIMVAWQAVGQQLAAFDIARQYAVERTQFGRPLARFQLIQQQLVNMLGNATASMGMMVRIAQLQEGIFTDAHGLRHGGADMAQVALAKAYCSARMRETVAMGRSILGGNGIVTDFGMAKVFADAEAIFTYEGSFEINSLIVGRAVTGHSAIV
ncbi:acyl-CoA dehydrogenase family protein [Arthrobacter sp. TES]|jgi:glutaryl-CoA dehydrogenase|uniref:acyl-CoA dehydrogenase family protein n=1 Tax=Paenarthrobacter ureafaciens TaxID=37931 RepID=UPI000398647D|nr:acyl-CoA dehydrogenase family protein [Paenarthrobacter ureafaciens]AOY72752.1 acyl-CoA dehydrogenase [Arthrobacter sp. ZXY-2]ERI38346.1 acyl-CoA dehydrogenase [Arthrobacter sp. AK-YN10]QOI64378.1 acyl-CoA dehydrogenase family protein [Arthrobacter sp. TES]GLU58968.1 glutaryl-CoA dehydrogenase [Paenarthrobacter ureafaciens]GLU63235.1 glutaryl-CoA dehydrogenase [Paenarthrobacter ureafaciens]